MEIYFGYNSAELTGLAKDYLKPVGEALASDKLKGLDFVVEVIPMLLEVMLTTKISLKNGRHQ